MIPLTRQERRKLLEEAVSQVDCEDDPELTYWENERFFRRDVGRAIAVTARRHGCYRGGRCDCEDAKQMGHSPLCGYVKRRRTGPAIAKD